MGWNETVNVLISAPKTSPQCWVPPPPTALELPRGPLSSPPLAELWSRLLGTPHGKLSSTAHPVTPHPAPGPAEGLVGADAARAHLRFFFTGEDFVPRVAGAGV